MALLLPRGRLKIQHARDPKDVIMEQVGDLSEFELFWNQVLVAIYEMPKDAKTVAGIIVPDKTRDESIFQGKAGLVVKLGPQAFVDSDDFKFDGQRVNVGDWVLVRPQEGWLTEINGNLMRIFRDTQIIARIPDPDYVF